MREKKVTVPIFARIDPEADQKIREQASRNRRSIGDELTIVILSTPKDGKYTNERRCVMVKHADGRIEIAPEFAATAEAPAEEQ